MPPAAQRPVPSGRAPQRRDQDRAPGRPSRSRRRARPSEASTAITVEGIAARAGVAKQTIYRWWPSKVDILLDTLLEDADRALTVPRTGPAIAGMRRYLRALARFLTDDPAGKSAARTARRGPSTTKRPPWSFTSGISIRSASASGPCCGRGIDTGELSGALDIGRLPRCPLRPDRLSGADRRPDPARVRRRSRRRGARAPPGLAGHTRPAGRPRPTAPRTPQMSSAVFLVGSNETHRCVLPNFRRDNRMSFASSPYGFPPPPVAWSSPSGSARSASAR